MKAILLYVVLLKKIVLTCCEHKDMWATGHSILQSHFQQYRVGIDCTTLCHVLLCYTVIRHDIYTVDIKKHQSRITVLLCSNCTLLCYVVLYFVGMYTVEKTVIVR